LPGVPCQWENTGSWAVFIKTTVQMRVPITRKASVRACVAGTGGLSQVGSKGSAKAVDDIVRVLASAFAACVFVARSQRVEEGEPEARPAPRRSAPGRTVAAEPRTARVETSSKATGRQQNLCLCGIVGGGEKFLRLCESKRADVGWCRLVPLRPSLASQNNGRRRSTYCSAAAKRVFLLDFLLDFLPNFD